MAKKKRKTKRTRSSPSGSNFAKGIVPVDQVMDNLVFLVYGRSGSGKTHFSSTFPKPILVIDVNEKGTDTIKGTSGIDLKRIKTWDEFEDGFWFLREGTKYKTIVVDQITNLQDFGMDEIRRRSKKTSQELFTRKNWGSLSGLLKEWISNYRGLSDQYNICLIAHQRTFDSGEEEMDEALDPSVGARVMPSVGSFLDGNVDAIGNTFIREGMIKKRGGKKEKHVDYCMRIGPHAFYSTKIRRPSSAGPLPDFISDPSYAKVMNLISGKITPAKKKTTKKRKKKLRRS